MLQKAEEAPSLPGCSVLLSRLSGIDPLKLFVYEHISFDLYSSQRSISHVIEQFSQRGVFTATYQKLQNFYLGMHVCSLWFIYDLRNYRVTIKLSLFTSH